ncbi:SUPPRESSOR OF GAMMA RESPONSE 1-like isoform X2 [Phragmites australis]|uniref:SUPPRESSOR OF GAMMA RESPONSE 1-like isoform X2 n=1 Tax=Phragmites australis TaxID=29695 RepID=UPI002D783C62|nr:SUPPRESSOR OF GAMMA RESPONSE 1-like isoform X2 [Phragmites australis]
MAKSWIMNGRGTAKKMRNPTQSFNFGLGELVAEAYTKCPNCQYCIDNSNISLEWPGLLPGVKFDPSDLQLLEHLEGKSSLPNMKSHVLINEFIPTIKEMEGICYTHPKNLPEIKMDGSSRHFFHRISNAYNCGKRKRRKINNSDNTVCDEHIRWHKTGRSKAICDDNGVQKGWKKILVLYTGSKRGGSKTGKAGWVMHQYHLGVDEDEKDEELVVSKVFYQLPSKQLDNSELDVSVLEYDASDKPEMDVSVFLEYDASDNSGMDVSPLEYDASAVKIDLRTPRADPPQPHRPNNSPCETEQYTPILPGQREEESSTSVFRVKDEAAECHAARFDAISQVVKDAAIPDLDEPVHAQPCLGTPPDLGALGFGIFGSQDSLGSLLDSFY